MKFIKMLYKSIVRCCLLMIILLGLSLSSKGLTHKYYSFNRYLYVDYTHVINDSLKIQFYSSSDIKYITEKLAIDQRIHEKFYGSIVCDVLAYGMNLTEPNYEFFVTLSPLSENQNTFDFKNEHFVIDTIINKYRISILAFAFEQEDTDLVKQETKKMLNSVNIGDDYLKDTPNLWSLYNIVPSIQGYKAATNYPGGALDDQGKNIKPNYIKPISKSV